jgi:hypothetical protein
LLQVYEQPDAGAQVPVAFATPLQTTGGPPRQATTPPPWQWSPDVQALPSLHCVVDDFASHCQDPSASQTAMPHWPQSGLIFALQVAARVSVDQSRTAQSAQREYRSIGTSGWRTRQRSSPRITGDDRFAFQPASIANVCFRAVNDLIGRECGQIARNARNVFAFR